MLLLFLVECAWESSLKLPLKAKLSQLGLDALVTVNIFSGRDDCIHYRTLFPLLSSRGWLVIHRADLQPGPVSPAGVFSLLKRWCSECIGRTELHHQDNSFVIGSPLIFPQMDLGKAGFPFSIPIAKLSLLLHSLSLI